MSRRAEYAEATKQAIVDAAREVFSQKGYFAARVEEIAATARVSPATVYAVAGGKQGLLRTLADEWAAAPVVERFPLRIRGACDPAEILGLLAALTRRMRQDYGDIIRLVLTTAPHEATAADGLARATARFRDGIAAVAHRLAELGALRPGVGAAEAVDVLWFHFGHPGFATLVDDNGWSYTRAERWLCEQARRALF
ncbi:TetR family transcriptional regulator [Pseudonocardia sp. CNS-139]|nr:TetR family transcriptional regulator [Pseudonocardia sp. CNS-139]